PPSLRGAFAPRCHLPRRAHPDARGRRPRYPLHAHPPAAPRLVGVRTQDRRAAVGRGRVPERPAFAYLHLWSDRLRGDRCRQRRRTRPRPLSDADGAVWPHRSLERRTPWTATPPSLSTRERSGRPPELGRRGELAQAV